MNNITYFIIAILFFSNSVCYSQIIVIGNIKTQNDKPLEGVNVSVSGVGSDLTTTSGEFRIKLPSSIKIGDKLKVDLIKEGWEPISIKDLEFVLPSNFILNPIAIRMRKNLVFKKSEIVKSVFSNVELTVFSIITGGKIKMDIVALNKSKSHLILNRINLKSNSPVPFQCMSGGGGGIDVSAEYKVDFHVSKGKSEKMEPPLLIQPNNASRFIVELDPDYTGACSRYIPFTISIELYSGEKKVAETNEYKFSSNEIDDSKRNSIESLREEVRNNPTDIYTMKRLANALGCCVNDDEQIKLWKNIVKISPNDLESCVNIAKYLDNSLWEKDNEDEVIYYFERALRIDSSIVTQIGYNVSSAYEEKIENFIKETKYKEADSLIKKVIKLSPQQAEFYFLSAKLAAVSKNINCDDITVSLRKYIKYKDEDNKEGFFKWNPRLVTNYFGDWLEEKLKEELTPLSKCFEINGLLKQLRLQKK